MKVKIEDATSDVLDELCEIEKQCFAGEAFSRQQIAYLLTDYNTIALTARVNNEIAGFIIGQIDIVNNTPEGHIITVNTVPAYRRKGIAHKLLHEIEALFKEKGIKECRLEVREDNIAAAELYQKLGYEKVGKLENYYGNAHGLYLKKAL
jgi:ribosomal-protein-alanine N-acetyltransferase